MRVQAVVPEAASVVSIVVDGKGARRAARRVRPVLPLAVPHRGSLDHRPSVLPVRTTDRYAAAAHGQDPRERQCQAAAPRTRHVGCGRRPLRRDERCAPHPAGRPAHRRWGRHHPDAGAVRDPARRARPGPAAALPSPQRAGPDLQVGTRPDRRAVRRKRLIPDRPSTPWCLSFATRTSTSADPARAVDRGPQSPQARRAARPAAAPQALRAVATTARLVPATDRLTILRGRSCRACARTRRATPEPGLHSAGTAQPQPPPHQEAQGRNQSQHVEER